MKRLTTSTFTVSLVLFINVFPLNLLNPSESKRFLNELFETKPVKKNCNFHPTYREWLRPNLTFCGPSEGRGIFTPPETQYNPPTILIPPVLPPVTPPTDSEQPR